MRTCVKPINKLLLFSPYVNRKTLYVKKDSRASTPEQQQQSSSSQQQSYIDSILRKIKSNINLIINDLTIKYVEEDLVLSINCHCLSYKGVDEVWKPSFVDLKEEVINVAVCM